MPPKNKYTDPKLRDEVKEEIHQSDKGGKPGQWSARKAQMMASEYKKRGGDYNTDKSEKDESQKNLSKWGEEDWQTKDGSGNAKQADGTEKRYLPKKAWDKMSEKEKKETDEKKLKESKKGKQHVANTSKAKQSRKKANKEAEEDQDEEDSEVDEEDEDSENDDELPQVDAEEEDEEVDEQDEEADHAKEDAKPGQKRGRGKQSADTSKKQKANDGKAKPKDDKSKAKPKDDKAKAKSSDEKAKPKVNNFVASRNDKNGPPAPAGSADRLPKKGQTVQWHSLPGYIEGEVVEIATTNKTVEGKKVKASKEDPRLVLRGSGSGKIAVHKPEACYFD